MVATMLVAAIVGLVYAALIVMHVAAIRGRPGATGEAHPRLATWLAGAGGRRRGRVETAAVRSLMAGRIERAEFHAAMAAMAAQDDAEHPLAAPETRP